jgi:pimeloyl-ACP methyl ester carboxylesterase
VFVRHHQHPDPDAPTVLLLHGWTASADLQFFMAYEQLGAAYSFVGVDHRGHGRGLRTTEPFRLEDAADDAAGVVRALGIDRVVTVGYSMGGPISLHLARRHPDLVAGLVVEATALEWRARRLERLRWRTVPVLGSVLRSWTYPHLLHQGVMRMLGPGHPLQPVAPWLEAEARRGDPVAIVQAGRALSRYDARPWAGQLDRPAAALITTRDRLVVPRRQRQLAAALGAHARELVGDHLAPWELPHEFAALTRELVDHVVARLAPAGGQSISSGRG